MEAAVLDRGDEPVRQKDISSMLDAALKQEMLAANAPDPTFLAHVELCSVPGAGTWLTAPPVPDGRAIDTPLFRVDVQRRLRLPVFQAMACARAVAKQWTASETMR